MIILFFIAHFLAELQFDLLIAAVRGNGIGVKLTRKDDRNGIVNDISDEGNDHPDTDERKNDRDTVVLNNVLDLILHRCVFHFCPLGTCAVGFFITVNICHNKHLHSNRLK